MKRRKRLPKGLRKYIRQEKARLRRQFLDLAEQERQIEEMYKRLGFVPDQKELEGGLPRKKLDN